MLGPRQPYPAHLIPSHPHLQLPSSASQRRFLLRYSLRNTADLDRAGTYLGNRYPSFHLSAVHYRVHTPVPGTRRLAKQTDEDKGGGLPEHHSTTQYLLAHLSAIPRDAPEPAKQNLHLFSHIPVRSHFTEAPHPQRVKASTLLQNPLHHAPWACQNGHSSCFPMAIDQIP